MFAVVMEYTIEKPWYNITLQKFLKENTYPLVITTQYRNHGRSSLIMQQCLLDGAMKELYVTVNYKSIVVEISSRKAFPGGDSFKEWAKDFTDPVAQVEYTIPDVPDGIIYSKKVTIENSDINRHQHADHAVYLRIALDAACSASRENYFKDFRGSFDVQSKVRHVKCTHLKECNVGDALTVVLWEDNEQSLHVQMQGVGGIKHFAASFRFYPLSSKY